MEFHLEAAKPAKNVTVHSPAANTAAVCTIAAPGLGYRIVVRGVTVSGSAAPAAAVQVTLVDGVTTRDSFRIPAAAFAPIRMNYGPGLVCNENAAVVLTLPALGGTTTGDAVIHYNIVAV